LFAADFPVDTTAPVAQPVGESADTDTNSEKKKKKFNFVVAPIPIVNPTTGNGLAVAALMLYKLDPKSRHR
jgi:hypothetical protein